MILRRITRAASALTAILVVGALGLACPAKDLDIMLSAPNAGLVFLSCNAPKACSALSQEICAASKLCAPDGAVCRGGCRIPGNPPPSFDDDLDLQVLLFATNPPAVHKPSACAPVAHCDAGDALCLRKALSAAIATSLAAGPELTFDGFHDTADGIVALAIFKRAGLSDGPDQEGCRPDHLIACAGLDVPLDKHDLDIVCSSCQSGALRANGDDTGPCPSKLMRPEPCFLRTCFSTLGGIIPTE